MTSGAQTPTPARSTRPAADLARRAAWTAALTARAPLEARFPYRSPATIERAQRRRLEATVAHAHQHVPFYRETMRRLALGPDEIRTATDLARLPTIDREALQRDPEYFRSEVTPVALPLRTSGTTGEPIVFFRDSPSLLQRLVGFQRIAPVVRGLVGRRLRLRRALIAPPDSSTSDVNRVTRGRLLPTVRTLHAVFSIYTPAHELADRIQAFRPDVITGYGSSIEAVFAELLGREDPGPLPSVVTYAADALSEVMRAEISALGVHVVSVYQAVETPTIGFECEAHTGHHLNVDLCPLRIVDEDGRDRPTGEAGEVVVSNLVNRGTVLLNYRLGDVAARLEGGCRCGRTLPRLSMVEGRVSQPLRTETGASIHPQALRGILRKVPGLLRYQLVQEQPGRVRVVAVVARDADRGAMTARLDAEAAGLDGLSIDITFAPTLSRTEGGKVRSLIA